MLKYFRFVKFEHSLFALPFALSSMLFAFEGRIIWEKVLWIVLCMVTARSAAMSFNRIVDREIDRKNPRTSGRELVTGRIKLGEAWAFFVFMSAAFIFFSYMLNMLCFYLSPVALFIICSYSFLKRFTSLCHLVLGLSLAIAPAGAWIAVRGVLELPAIILSLSVLFWVTSFDIIYSLMDYDFDRKTGLYSIPSRFGEKAALHYVKLFHVLMAGFIIWFGYYTGVSVYFYLFVVAMVLLLVIENYLSNKRDVRSLNKAFFHVNAAIGLLLFTASVIEFISKSGTHT